MESRFPQSCRATLLFRQKEAKEFFASGQSTQVTKKVEFGKLNCETERKFRVTARGHHPSNGAGLLDCGTLLCLFIS
jgi:hypothetical protein